MQFDSEELDTESLSQSQFSESEYTPTFDSQKSEKVVQYKVLSTYKLINLGFQLRWRRIGP
jgi:hypothetical protein